MSLKFLGEVQVGELVLMVVRLGETISGAGDQCIACTTQRSPSYQCLLISRFPVAF